jgi:hypothetical protein
MRLRDVPLVGWVSYLPLLFVLAAVVAAVCGLGAALGAPSLIWHDDGVTQLFAGLAAGMLCVHLGMVGYLLDSEENPDRAVAPDTATFGSVAGYTLWPVTVLGLAVLGSFCFQKETHYHGAGVLVGPGLVCFALWRLRRGDVARRPLADLLPTPWRRRLVALVERHHARVSLRRRAPTVDPGAHAVQAALMLALGALYVLIWIFERFVPAAVAVGVAFSLGTGLWGLLRFWTRRFLAVGMTSFVLGACLLGVTRDAPVTGLAKIELPGLDPAPRALLSDESVLARWKAGLGEAKPPLVVVATSGGAARAAVWTINVLASLDREIPGFLRHVRLITGASGGMVGAGHLVAALGPAGPTVPMTTIMEGAAADSLTAVTRALILPHSNRGQALETAWERNSDGRMAVPFRALAAGEAEGWRPSLVYTPMMVEDGRRLVVSNLDLGALTEALGPRLDCAANCPQSKSAVQLFACGGDGLDALKLSTVARLSATFPWVTSAALLPSTPSRRVVDAGYYDNYGVDVGAAWIRKNADWLRANTSGVLLLRLRDSVEQAFDLRATAGPGYFHEWVSAATTPIEAFLQARESTMSFRNDEEVGFLAADPRLAPGTHFFVTETFEFAGEAPLEWYLGRASIDRLEQPPPEADVSRLKSWWATRR